MSDQGERLLEGLVCLGIPDPQAAANRIGAFLRLLAERSRTVNLIGCGTANDVLARHVFDSLAPIGGVRPQEPIVDVGSGAGFPGLVVAAAFPASRTLLLEPRERRAAFLLEAARACELENVTIEVLRAEEAGRGRWRENAGTVLVRAVAEPAVSLEYGAPLLRVGGRLLLYMGRRAQPSVEELRVAGALGMLLVRASGVEVPYLRARRHAWIFLKDSATPAGFPRRTGVPARRPLTRKSVSRESI